VDEQQRGSSAAVLCTSSAAKERIEESNVTEVASRAGSVTKLVGEAKDIERFNVQPGQKCHHVAPAHCIVSTSAATTAYELTGLQPKQNVKQLHSVVSLRTSLEHVQYEAHGEVLNVDAVGNTLGILVHMYSMESST
jgi:hypothetical protein